MDKLKPELPPRLSEEEIEQEIARRDRERAEQEQVILESNRQNRERRERLTRGIPTLRYPDVFPEAWIGGLIHGPAGCGKTHKAIARLLSTENGVFMGAADWVGISRALEFDSDDAFAQARFNASRERAHLVLDDLGSRRPTGFAIDAVYNLVDHRWLAKLETIVTSNLHPKDIADAWGDRIASRILGFGPAEFIQGRDWRVV